MACADAGAVVAVKVFVEQHMIPPVRIPLKQFRAAEHRPPAITVPKERPDEATRKLRGHLPDRRLPSRPEGIFHPVLIAEKEMKLLKRFDEQIVDGEPDRSAPIRIPAELRSARFRRLVVDSVLMAHDVQDVRMIPVIAGQGANAVRRKELILVEEIAHNRAKPVPVDEREKAPDAALIRLRFHML